ncbi:hypothetical protein GWG65_02885 [Bradyrhizobium sp. CSA207]|uniref:beta strand repeat-containing protein n=1 Tax=Bradyrhizobium sp. CSA207 TaxID=2698826 RepID=UPI0023B13FA6|nr:hypothetical protein [Bradyrhizobium sp. CSA207]MDE5440408.1 hypothetical protein [Bradyrhizobium sp. CSA207]
MRSLVLAVVFGLMASAAVAQDWGKMATISSTMGVSASRLCLGEGSRGDIGCPAYAPSVTTAGDVSISGNLSASKFYGDGSGLTNIGAAGSSDRIVSSTTSMLAISSTGYVSLTQSGVNTGWFDPSRGLVTIGVSSTGPISGTNGYFSGPVIMGVSTTDASLKLNIPTASTGSAITSTYTAGSVDQRLIEIIRNTNPNPSAGAPFAGYAADAYDSVSGTYNRAYFGLQKRNNTGGYGEALISAPRDLAFFVANESLSFNNYGSYGTEAMRIVSSGYVGIGTLAPSTTLYVKKGSSGFNGALNARTVAAFENSSANSGAAISIIGGSGTDAIFFGDPTNEASGQVAWNIGAKAISLYTASGNTFIQTQNGNTYIGSPVTGWLSPTATLYVSGTAINTSWTALNMSTLATAPLEVSGTISATRFVGDGSGLTGISGSSGDSITSGSTKVTANSTGYVSFTTGGTTTGYMNTAGVFVLPGVSSTGPISATNVYATNNVVANAYQATNGFGLNWGNWTTQLVGNSTGGYMAFITSGTEAMRIVSSGMVGIGTNSPSATLHVVNASGFEQIDVDTMNAGGRAELQLRERGSSVGIVRVRGSGNTDPGLMQIGTTSASGGLALLSGNSTEAARIVSSGNVGIGTSTPTAKLDISGSTATIQVNPIGAASDRNYIGFTGRVQFGYNGTTQNAAIQGGAGKGIEFNVSNSFGLGRAMVIDSNGKVGIGITPSVALEVSGTVSATNFVGNGSGLTGIASTGDRIVSGSVNMVAEQTSGTVRVSGTLAMVNTGNEVCNAATWYSFRVNPSTGMMQMCRP